jgi:hypothetical protein
MKQAAEIAELSSDDIEDIFWRNATEALKIGNLLSTRSNTP